MVIILLSNGNYTSKSSPSVNENINLTGGISPCGHILTKDVDYMEYVTRIDNHDVYSKIMLCQQMA